MRAFLGQAPVFASVWPKAARFESRRPRQIPPSAFDPRVRRPGPA
jgi:hypothetical protein